MAERVFPPPPLEPAALAAPLRPLRQARMPPPAAYTDEEVFAWERRVFFGGWQCAGLSAQLQPGDYRAERLGPGGVLLTRDGAGVARAFANTCRHRGHELLPCGTASAGKAIVCPYHSWAYELNGSLRGAPGFGGRPEFAASDWGLIPLPVTEWHGLVFADGSGEDVPLAGSLATLAPLVAPYQPERLVVTATHDYEVAANWKIITENFHECYHCPAIHPQLCKVSPPDSGDNFDLPGIWIGGRMDLRDGAVTMSADGSSGGVILPGLADAGRGRVLYVNVFPNVLISLHPDYVMAHRLVPLAAGATRIECAWLFPPEALARPGFDPGYAVEFWDVTNRQDWRACEGVQRGLASPAAAPGPLSDREDAVHLFAAMIARGYLGERVWNPGRETP